MDVGDVNGLRARENPLSDEPARRRDHEIVAREIETLPDQRC